MSLVLSWSGFAGAQPAGAGEDLSGSMVRVYLRRGFPGVIEAGQRTPNVQVDEVTELQGAFVGSGGHVISYLGGFLPASARPGVTVEWWIETADGRRHAAEIVGVDERVALAVFVSPQVERKSLLFGPEMEGGELRLASFSDGNLRVTVPMIMHTSHSRVLPSRSLVVLEAKGVSSESDPEGGFILDGKGQLVGVIRRGYQHPFSNKIRIWEVLPSRVLEESLDLILSGQRTVGAGWLGIVPVSSGSRMQVLTVVPGSPADLAGIHPGDLLLTLDGEPVPDRAGLLEAIRWKGAGGDLSLSVLRSGQVRTLSAHLTTRQDLGPTVSWRVDFSSLQGGESSLEERMRVFRSVVSPMLDLGLILGAQMATGNTPLVKVRGLEIRAVLPESRALELGLKEGDLLTEINGRALESPGDYRESIGSRTGGEVELRFLRKGRFFTKTLTLP